ncbi:hypothetical protein C0993_006578 [Termitomyces sp. T159_Od127]|nr:hypothetical protein C0993_006578 [Termitomyces sp. T159_Od127]
MKRPCTLDDAKTCERGNAPNPVVERTYHWAVLVRRVWEVVERARKAEARSEAVTLSKKSLALMRQDAEEKKSSKSKRKASSSLSLIEKEKKRARVVSPVVVTPKVESEEEEEDEAHRLAMAIEASKAVPGRDDLAGPNHQAEVPQVVGDQQKDEEQQEEAEVRPEATPQVHPWDEELPQWSWLPEWSASDPATWDMFSSNKPELWEPRHRVMARYNPQWTSPPAPRITGEVFEWLRKDLVHLVVPLQLAEFLERIRVWATQIERILVRKREAVQVKLMGLHLWYSTLRQSVETLCNYQEDMMQVLEWQEENNIQEGDLLYSGRPQPEGQDIVSTSFCCESFQSWSCT